MVEEVSGPGSDLAPYTLEGYGAVYRLHLEWWEGRSILEVSTRTIGEWAAHLRAKGLRGKAIKNAAVVLLRYHEERPDYALPRFPTVKTGDSRKQAECLSRTVSASAKRFLSLRGEGISTSRASTRR